MRQTLVKNAVDPLEKKLQNNHKLFKKIINCIITRRVTYMKIELLTLTHP